MKKLLLTLIVTLAMCGSIFAQYESHWPGFYYPDFRFQTPCVAAIAIDGEIVTADNHPDNWNALEIAFFVGDQCRGASVEFGTYNPEVNFLNNYYVEEYGDPFPIIDGAPVYYTNAGEEVTVKMFDHVNNIEYNECTITLEGQPYTIYTGDVNNQGWLDPDNPIILNFTTPCAITVPYAEDFESWTDTNKLYTTVLPDCWTVAHEYTSPTLNDIGEHADTLPQLYRAFNHTQDGHYSLRIKFRSILAMPKLADDVDLSRLRLKMYVRQPHTYYNLEVGVMEDLNDESTFKPVALVHHTTHAMTYFECGFNNYIGEGRYIAFRNVGGNANDPYCSNYLDDITLTYPDESYCTMLIPFEENFESIIEEEDIDITESPIATGVEPHCWEIVNEEEDAFMSSDTKPQLYAGFNMEDGELSDEGTYTLRMKNSCVYAMPALNEDEDIHNLTMTFSLRQAKFVYRLQVGVVDDQNYFNVVKTFNFRSENPVQAVSVDFSEYDGNSTVNRIAFRNTVRDGVDLAYSTNYIDDIYIDHTNAQQPAGRATESDMMDVDSYLENIDVYPNPTTGKLHIDAVDVQKVECYNVMGQLVSVYDNVRDIDLGSLSEGVYTLRITVPQGVTMRKVVKK